MSNLKEKLAKFVEQEQKTGVDVELLETLRSLSTQETFYWNLSPEKRNTLNEFFSELHSELESGIIGGKYQAGTLIDWIIITAFETGVRYGHEHGDKF